MHKVHLCHVALATLPVPPLGTGDPEPGLCPVRGSGRLILTICMSSIMMLSLTLPRGVPMCPPGHVFADTRVGMLVNALICPPPPPHG